MLSLPSPNGGARPAAAGPARQPRGRSGAMSSFGGDMDSSPSADPFGAGSDVPELLMESADATESGVDEVSAPRACRERDCA